MSFPANTHVLPARAQIDIKTLHNLRNVAHDARRGQATQSECDFLLVTMGPLLDELILWRRIAAGDLPLEDAVACLQGGR
jgi:hypothetical protein